MTDYWRETFSYFGLYKKMGKVKKVFTPEYFNYSKLEDGKTGKKEKYFLYYEPKTLESDKIIIWIHGVGWNAGNPKYYDYVGDLMDLVVAETDMLDNVWQVRGIGLFRLVIDFQHR